MPADEKPAYIPPADACDTHCHIFGPADRYPFGPNQSYTPPDAPLDALRALHGRLGFARAVIVNATAYGTDHRIAFDAVAASGGRYRAVGNFDASTTEAQLERLTAGGFRGCRFSFLEHLGGLPDMRVVERVTRMVAAFGWHVDLLIDAARLPDYSDFLSRLTIPYVINHMGRIDARQGAGQPDVKTLTHLLETDEHCWVKLSGADRVAVNAPALADALPIARAIIAAAPDRVVWGTDWPHPHVKVLPSDAALVDLIPLMAPEAGVQEAMLVHNPARLYGF